MSTPGTIALVARREFITRARTKSFIISNAIILVLILGGIIAASIFSGGSDSRPKLGLVGDAASLSAPLTATADATGVPVDTSTVPDEAAARAKVSSGDLDVALVPREGGSYTAVVKKEIPKALQATITAAVRQQSVNAALSAQRVEPATLTQAAARATVTVDAANPPNPDANQRTALAYIALLVMFFQIFLFGIYVAMGVVEEKSSRVVEVLLATIKPLHLLWGKVAGIGAVGLVQLVAYGVVGLAAGLGTGLVTVTGTAVGVFASVLVWFILGFAFYAVLYAAAGSLVSPGGRQLCCRTHLDRDLRQLHPGSGCRAEPGQHPVRGDVLDSAVLGHAHAAAHCGRHHRRRPDHRLRGAHAGGHRRPGHGRRPDLRAFGAAHRAPVELERCTQVLANSYRPRPRHASAGRHNREYDRTD